MPTGIPVLVHWRATRVAVFCTAVVLEFWPGNQKVPDSIPSDAQWLLLSKQENLLSLPSCLTREANTNCSHIMNIGPGDTYSFTCET